MDRATSSMGRWSLTTTAFSFYKIVAGTRALRPEISSMKESARFEPRARDAPASLHSSREVTLLRQRGPVQSSQLPLDGNCPVSTCAGWLVRSGQQVVRCASFKASPTPDARGARCAFALSPAQEELHPVQGHRPPVDQLWVVQTARVVAYPWESPPIGDWEIPGRQLRLRPHHRDLCGLIHPQIGPDRSPMPSAGATTCR